MRSGMDSGDAPTGSNVVPAQASPPNSVPAFLEIEDLKRKVTRLIEQVGQNTQAICTLTPLIPRVDLADNQIIRWRHRLPHMATDMDAEEDDEVETVVTAIQVREERQAFKESARRRITEARDVITALEDRVNILRRAREDSWEVVTNRVTSEVDKASATLSESSRSWGTCAVTECITRNH